MGFYEVWYREGKADGTPGQETDGINLVGGYRDQEVPILR